MSKPVVSVLMSAYNTEQYVAEAVKSILKQTFTDFEFLIIDDGSTDSSLKILKRFAAQDPRIQLISRENRGIARTRNELLNQAQGEFIAVTDSDDITAPNRLALQVEFLRQHPEIVCVASSFDVVDEKNRYLSHCDVPLDDADIQQLLLKGISLLMHPVAMFRKSVLLEIGGYDEAMVASSDLDLWLRMGEVGKLANLPETLLRYRLNKRSISHRKQTNQRDHAQEACERAWKRRGIQGEFVGDHTDRLHQHEFLLKSGWLGFNTGRRGMAIDYGLQAISSQPRSLESWRLLVCALIKPLPQVQNHV